MFQHSVHCPATYLVFAVFSRIFFSSTYNSTVSGQSDVYSPKFHLNLDKHIHCRFLSFFIFYRSKTGSS
jgi:hypothetical protein